MYHLLHHHRPAQLEGQAPKRRGLPHHGPDALGHNRSIPPNPLIMTIQEAQQRVDEWIRQYGVRYFSELTNMACLTEEVGELARVMARTYGDQSFKAGEKPNLGEEMADVLWFFPAYRKNRRLVKYFFKFKKLL